MPAEFVKRISMATSTVYRDLQALQDEVGVAAWHSSSTTWCRNEQLHPDGTLDVTFQVGGLLEITPWVLSWGAAVEVLSPPQQCRSVAGSARAQTALYSDRS